MKTFEEYNQELLMRLSTYLNETPHLITTNQISKVCSDYINEERAFILLLSEYLEIHDTEFIDAYFYQMIHLLDIEWYKRNPYYQNIQFEKKKYKHWTLKYAHYQPYELFVQNDFQYEEHKVIPNLGFFNKPFYYPAIYQDSRLWMSITPNEINTMKTPIEKAQGNVLTFGLGLGYFAYMCSLKQEVKHVTIVEKDKDVIELFNNILLPQFPFKDKIEIIQIDAYDFMNLFEDGKYDYAFVDIYHDASDGKEVYLNFQKYLKKVKQTRFDFWIMDTIRYYL